MPDQLALALDPLPPRPARVRSGVERRDAALASLEAIYVAWLRAMRAQAITVCRERGTVTADDLRDFAEELARAPLGLVPRSANAWGTIFSPKVFEQVGMVKSTKPSSHATDIRVWQLRTA